MEKIALFCDEFIINAPKRDRRSCVHRAAPRGAGISEATGRGAPALVVHAPLPSGGAMAAWRLLPLLPDPAAHGPAPTAFPVPLPASSPDTDVRLRA